MGRPKRRKAGATPQGVQRAGLQTMDTQPPSDASAEIAGPQTMDTQSTLDANAENAWPQTKDAKPTSDANAETLGPQTMDALSTSDVHGMVASGGDCPQMPVAKTAGSQDHTGDIETFPSARKSSRKKITGKKAQLRATSYAEPRGWTLAQNERIHRLNASCNRLPLVQPVADTLQVPPVVVALSGAIALTNFVLFGCGGQLVCFLVGVSYPAFETFKVLDQFVHLADPRELYAKADGMQFWLTYWVVVAMLASFEFMFSFAMIQIRFFYVLKLLLLMWLYLPSTQGANHVYYWLVSPILRRNRRIVDAALMESQRTLQESGEAVGDAVGGVVSGAVGAGLSSVLQLQGVARPFAAECAKQLANGQTTRKRTNASRRGNGEGDE